VRCAPADCLLRAGAGATAPAPAAQLAAGRAAQGVVESRTLADAAGRRFALVLLARRSRLHPGMRYIARGLNALASPGNEIECEQLVWTAAAGAGAGPADPGSDVPRSDPGSAAGEAGGGGGAGAGGGSGAGVEAGPGAGGPHVRWASVLWRRGTVPIWWGVELRSGGVGEATIVVSPSRPYRGTLRRVGLIQPYPKYGVCCAMTCSAHLSWHRCLTWPPECRRRPACTF